jgi:hypothetical protein
MSVFASIGISTRVLVYAMISTLVVSFATLGASIAAHVAPEYALLGLLLGSALGASIAVYESTVFGCVVGTIGGLILAPFVYAVLDFETAYMVVFVFSLFGAILGEPLAGFWQEADLSTRFIPDDDNDPHENDPGGKTQSGTGGKKPGEGGK